MKIINFYFFFFSFQIPRKICVERQLSTCASRLSYSPGPLSQFTDDELLMKESGSYAIVVYFQLYLFKLPIYVKSRFKIKKKQHLKKGYQLFS